MNAAYGRDRDLLELSEKPFTAMDIKLKQMKGDVILYDPHRAVCHSCPKGTEYTLEDVSAFWGGASFQKHRKKRPQSAKALKSPTPSPHSTQKGTNNVVRTYPES